MAPALLGYGVIQVSLASGRTSRPRQCAEGVDLPVSERLKARRVGGGPSPMVVILLAVIVGLLALIFIEFIL